MIIYTNMDIVADSAARNKVANPAVLTVSMTITSATAVQLFVLTVLRSVIFVESVSAASAGQQLKKK